ncbi:MAG: acyl-CoA thioesterase [Burkholderiaceae bacterium]|nr:MAG: acyl-CoA thioesterase [Burkholderiaceae bacterium]
MVWPDQSNHHGTLFGGAALSMLDRLAFVQGSRALRGTVVTAAVGRLDFMAPVPAGHAVEGQARLLRRGVRSAVVAGRLVAEDLLSGRRTLCLAGEFTMVRRASAAVEGLPAAQTATARADASTGPGAEPARASESPRACRAAGRRPRPLATARVAEIVFPGHANHRGILHGGPAMAWMAKAGFVAATRQTRRSVVMACSERMDFVAPARVGEVVEVLAEVVATGRRSVRVAARMEAECPVTGERRRCTTAELVYVVVRD